MVRSVRAATLLPLEVGNTVMVWDMAIVATIVLNCQLQLLVSKGDTPSNDLACTELPLVDIVAESLNGPVNISWEVTKGSATGIAASMNKRDSGRKDCEERLGGNHVGDEG